MPDGFIPPVPPTPTSAFVPPVPTEQTAPPVATKEQIQEVRAATDRFTPARFLPVSIDFSAGSDPYELSEDVYYDNDIVKVKMEKGFRWDGASIPPWIPIVPWVATIGAMHFWPTPWMWLITGVLVVYSIRLLPYMQKMGLHARAACVHDKLCRAQTVARVIADAIFLSIMESDNVPIDVRLLMHGRVRRFGWIAWNRNKRALRAKSVAQEDVEIHEDSSLAPPPTEPPQNK